MSAVHTEAPQRGQGSWCSHRGGAHSGPVSMGHQLRVKGGVLSRGWFEVWGITSSTSLGSTCSWAKGGELKCPCSEGRGFPNSDKASTKV